VQGLSCGVCVLLLVEARVREALVSFGGSVEDNLDLFWSEAVPPEEVVKLRIKYGLFNVADVERRQLLIFGRLLLRLTLHHRELQLLGRLHT
jgi:hypothetical protein